MKVFRLSALDAIIIFVLVTVFIIFQLNMAVVEVRLNCPVWTE